MILFANSYLRIDGALDVGKVEVTFLLKIPKIRKDFSSLRQNLLGIQSSPLG